MCKLYVCVCEGKTESGRERVGSYVIKRNFVAKTWTRFVDFMLLFTVFICLASVVVGFGYFSVVRPVK